MPRKYTVKPGDTLERIAIRECGSRRYVDEIARLNSLANASRIYVGQVLTLTCGDAPTTTPGNTTAPIPTTGSTPSSGSGTPVTTTPPPVPTTPTPPAPTTPAAGGVPRFISTRPGEVLLNVPYYSQEDPDAKYAGADCGPTCLRMLVGWHRLHKLGEDSKDLKVDDVTKAVGIRGGQFSFPVQLVRAAEKYGLKLIETRKLNLPAIQAEIDAGRPVISLIHYGTLSKRQNQRFRGGHFVVVVGYNERDVILNDPDWWGERRNEGKLFRVPRSEFETAIGSASYKAGNSPHWGVMVDPKALD
jgi:LysM repeat protein/uncharacterized protein YvpB